MTHDPLSEWDRANIAGIHIGAIQAQSLGIDEVSGSQLHIGFPVIQQR